MEERTFHRKPTSTELPDDFDDIVNEINDFIADIEERAHNNEIILGESEEFFSTPRITTPPRNSLVQFGEPVNDEPIYESFQDVEENAYEPIGAARNVINVSETPPTFIPTVAVTATATANLISPKPELKPKPKNLPIRKMVEPLNQGQQPKRVKAIYNFKGTNNDESEMPTYLDKISSQ
ncbi:hypothetical protein KUTeg_012122 [Tegillarca granosa]|uniref:Uncharacterized protein n=1 Tax=Tegillarca granosa TaxID=220873 RepID=A0ABQ9F2Z1_TEGGR|nr:hypothetical protein KUTeg_012122 [Tegillarca granosa]